MASAGFAVVCAGAVGAAAGLDSSLRCRRSRSAIFLVRTSFCARSCSDWLLRSDNSPAFAAVAIQRIAAADINALFKTCSPPVGADGTRPHEEMTGVQGRKFPRPQFSFLLFCRVAARAAQDHLNGTDAPVRC